MIKIEEVVDRRGLTRFVDLPFRLYCNDPNWVPPLKREVRSVLDTTRNPFWQHARGKLFLATKDDETVGRIAAIVDDNFVTFRNEKSGYFGFYESVDDFDVANLLYRAALDYNRSQGMSRFYGPMNPSINDECGFLADGFDTPPFIMMPHTHRYYLDLAERFGFVKARNLYAYYVDAAAAPYDYLARVGAMVRRRLPGLVVRPVNMKKFDEEVQRIKVVYNDAWSNNWGFVPMTEREFDDIAKRLKSLIVPELVLIAELDGKPVGVSLAVPNYNQVLARLNGRLGPVELIKFLIYRSKINEARVMIMGTRKAYRMMGIEAIFFYESFRFAQKAGYKGGEMSWILEDNVLTNRTIAKMGGRVYKTYRVYQYDIKQGAVNA